MIICMRVLLCMNALILTHCFFSASFCAASDIFASWWLLLHKAAVTGTALTCHCVRPTTMLAPAGHPQAAAAVLHRETRRWWRVSHQRRRICNTISMNMGHHPWRKYDAWTDLFWLLFWHFICLKYRNCTRKCNNAIKKCTKLLYFVLWKAPYLPNAYGALPTTNPGWPQIWKPCWGRRTGLSVQEVGRS